MFAVLLVLPIYCFKLDKTYEPHAEEDTEMEDSHPTLLVLENKESQSGISVDGTSMYKDENHPRQDSEHTQKDPLSIKKWGVIQHKNR
jgi:hypothetical protein